MHNTTITTTPAPATTLTSPTPDRPIANQWWRLWLGNFYDLRSRVCRGCGHEVESGDPGATVVRIDGNSRNGFEPWHYACL